jgi:hypothetical protein
VWAVCEGFVETGLGEAEEERGEFTGEELDDLVGGWRREEDRVYTVDYAIGAEL